MDNDPCVISFSQDTAFSRILVQIAADRSAAEKPSYNYTLRLTAEDVVNCLFTLHPSAVAAAVTQLGNRFDLSKVVPELIKHFAVGAIPPAATRDDSLGKNDDPDEFDYDMIDDEDDEV